MNGHYNTEAQNVRKQRALDNSFFPVTKVRDDNRLGYALVDEFGNKLSNVSERYELVHNRRLIQPIVDRLGVDKLVTYRRQGNKFFYQFDTGREINFGEGDKLKHRIVVWNSYDKTKSYDFAQGAFRMVCSNGLYTLEAGTSFKKKHVGDIPVEKHVQEILNGIEGVQFNFWESLQKVNLTQDDKRYLISMFEAFNNPKEYSRNEDLNYRVRYNANYQNDREVNVNSQPNGWGLLNNINWGISRTLGTKNTQGLISANLRLEEYLKTVVLN